MSPINPNGGSDNPTKPSQETQSAKDESSQSPKPNKTIMPTEPNNQLSITQQVVNHLKTIPGIHVYGKDVMGEYLKTHGITNSQQYISKSSLPKGEMPTLSSALMTKYGNNPSYGDVIQTANYEYTVNYKGAGEFEIIEYHQIDNNLSKEYYDRKSEGFPEYADERAIQNEITRQKYNSDSYNVENGETNGNNAGLDIQTSQGESNQTSSNASSSQHQEWREIKRDSATGRITFIDGDGRTISTPEDWNSIETFTTPQGEVYGLVDKEGNIYHDDIAKNHGNPQVVFMVDHEVAEPKHFDKDAAQQYQLSQLKPIGPI